jgi:hypothetical protein
VKDPFEAVTQIRMDSVESQASFITRKEHPVEKNRIVFYLHQCQLPEIFEEETS